MLVYILFAWMVGIPLLRDGMFIDGVQYAAVSRNLAHGIGSWWEPHFSKTLFDRFHQQPPGFIWLQSIFFRVIGDSIYPERVYCLASGIIMLFLLAQLWKTLNQNPSIKEMTWLPQLIWLTIPTISWGLRNNVVENTMVIFDLLCVMFLIRAFEKRNEISSLLFAVVFLFCASFIKGIQGLFPLIAPALYWLITGKISFRRMIVISISILSSIAAIYFLLLKYPPALKSYEEYFEARLTGFPHTGTQTTDNRIWLLSQFIPEMSIPIILFLTGAFLTMIKRSEIKNDAMWRRKQIMFFLSIGLSASLPLMVSYEQRTFYLITSIPFFVIAVAFSISPIINYLIEEYSHYIKRYGLLQIIAFVGLLISVIIGVLNAGEPGRDEDPLNDVNAIREDIGANRVVSVSPAVMTQWFLHGYFQRYANISLAPDCDSCNYYLQLKNGDKDITEGYKKLDLKTKYLDVYEKVPLNPGIQNNNSK